MLRRMKEKAHNTFGTGTLLVLCLCVLVPLCVRGEDRRNLSRWTGRRGVSTTAGEVSGSFERLPLESARDRDEVVLKNEDSLSGKVTGVRDGTVCFQADMAEGEVRAPVGNLESVFFGRRTEHEVQTGTPLQPMSGEIALAEGGRFGATIHRLDGKRLFFSLASSPDSAEMGLELDKIASMSFSGGPLVLLQADFSDANSSPFRANEGEWFVYDGRFLQGDPSHHDATAYARVKQQGLVKYSWTLHKSDWGHGSVYILSSKEKPEHRGQGYRIHLEHNRFVLYKLEETGESLGFWCSIAPGMTVARVDATVNCPEQRIRIGLNGREIAHLRDTGPPVQTGGFVVLAAMGRAAFDDVRVEQFGADAAGAEADAREDTLILKNGDRVVGKVTQISEDKVVIRGGLPPLSRPTGQPLMMDREKVLRVVFGGRTSVPAGRPQVMFHNESRLEGAVRSLENDVLEVENPVLGRVRFRTAAVKCILF